MMGKFVSLVKGKKDPEVVRKEVRAEMSRLDEGLYSLEFDMKKMRKERERIIQKGVRAAKEGDAVLKQEAALDLKSMNAELAYMQMNRSNVVKTKMLHRISLRRLTSALPGGTQDGIQKALAIYDDPEIKDMLENGECNEERFQELLDKKTDTMMRGIEDRFAGAGMEISAEAGLFDQLAAAEEKGDTEAVSDIMNQMTGEKDKSGKVDSLLS